MIARPTRTDWGFLLILGLMWGTSYAFIKLGVENGLPTFTLIATRLLIGLVLLAVVVFLAKEPLPRSPRIYGHLFLMSLINIVLPFFLITTAERSVDSAIAAVINGAVPLFVILLAALAFHDEPITVNKLVGLVVGYIGVIVIVSPGLASTTGSELNGELALLGSTISYAFGAVYARRMIKGLRPMIPAVFQVFFAFVVVSVLAVLTEQPFEIEWNGNAILAVVWLGVFGSGFAYLANFRLLGRIGATRTSQLAYLLPAVGIATGAVMLNEKVEPIVLAGTALVLSGIALVNSRRGERQIFGRSARKPAPKSEPSAS
jgi:drug/metabolite transporter (DMT)-like permease